VSETVKYRSGFMAIVGRPNVGKSTMMNNVLGTKVAIVTPKPQTTRNKITGIATYDDCQVVFLDTPGIHEARGSLNRLMVDVAYSSLEDADAVCFMVDVSHEAKWARPSSLNLEILERVQNKGLPVILALNKVDKVSKEKLLPLIAAYSEVMPFAAIVPMSALQGDGVPRLLEETKALMPEGEKYYEAGQLTDRSRNFIITEFVREQVFLLTKEEIPYSTAVSIDIVEDRESENPLLHVIASIHVERKSQKGMLIGKQGRMIKEIGSRSRLEMEKYLKSRVFLELHVRIEKEWTRSLKGMKKVGYET
jgi:GTP-binding protein Era